jgi:catechol 2,3-dioxygenase-like lactoylglutathione lyase family enzyme
MDQPTYVSLTGLSVHVTDLEAAKAWYLALPGAEIDHEKKDFNCVIRLGAGRINLVRLNRSEDFHIEIGTSDLDAMRAHLEARGIVPDGPQPEKWGQRGIIVRDPDNNLVEFDDQL